ncbi:MAG TPA: hypothetical protein VFU88_07220 [Ktedonobacterales bacterium]|nr:hypothetical protein [Ktedonobacterales bacterium]
MSRGDEGGELTMATGPYQFYWYNSFSCRPTMMVELARPHLARGGRVRFQLPLADGRILVVIEFADGIGMVEGPQNRQDFKFACVPDVLDSLLNLNAITGGRVTSIVPYGANQILVSMELLKVPDNSRR